MARQLVIPAHTVHIDHFAGRQGLLSGVWFNNAQADPYDPEWDYHLGPVEFMFFMIDGVIYRVQEDPDDGYRSHLRDIQVCGSLMPLNVWQPPEPVIGNYVRKKRDRWKERIELAQHADDDDYYYHDEECSLLELVSMDTHKCVLEFGTANTDDYYPYFVASFHPENMGINRVANMLGEEKGK